MWSEMKTPPLTTNHKTSELSNFYIHKLSKIRLNVLIYNGTKENLAVCYVEYAA